MKKILIFFIIVCFAHVVSAQCVYNLDDCMDYAVQNNYKICSQINQNKNNELDYTASWLDMLPTIEARVGANFNFGRGIDPATNNFVNTSTFNNGLGVNGSLPVFSGFNIINSVRSAKVSKLKGSSQLRLVQDQIAVQTMIAYAEVIYNRELIELSVRRIDNYGLQELMIINKCNIGVGSESDLAQIRALIASEKFRLIEIRNAVDISMLKLKDCMNFPLNDTLVVDSRFESQCLYESDQSMVEIIEFAMQINPKAVIGRYDLDISEYRLNMARSAYYPSVYVSGGLSTNYFTRLDNQYVGDFEPWAMQLKNNVGEYVGVTMSVPIFNGFRSRVNVRKAKNDLRQMNLDITQSNRELESQIMQSIMELQASQEQYEQAQKNVIYHKLANDVAVRKYEAGLLSIIDIQISNDQLFGSEIELRNSYLRHQIKIREVNYYKGIPYVDTDQR